MIMMYFSNTAYRTETHVLQQTPSRIICMLHISEGTSFLLVYINITRVMRLFFALHCVGAYGLHGVIMLSDVFAARLPVCVRCVCAPRYY